MDKQKFTDKELDEVLAQVSRDVEVPKRLQLQVLRDAARLQPHAVTEVQIEKKGFRGVISLFGGWQGCGGLAAAACAGLWLGINPPATLPVPFENINAATSDWTETEAVYLTGFGWDIEDG